MKEMCVGPRVMGWMNREARIGSFLYITNNIVLCSSSAFSLMSPKDL